MLLLQPVGRACKIRRGDDPPQERLASPRPRPRCPLVKHYPGGSRGDQARGYPPLHGRMPLLCFAAPITRRSGWFEPEKLGGDAMLFGARHRAGSASPRLRLWLVAEIMIDDAWPVSSLCLPPGLCRFAGGYAAITMRRQRCHPARSVSLVTASLTAAAQLPAYRVCGGSAARRRARTSSTRSSAHASTSLSHALKKRLAPRRASQFSVSRYQGSSHRRRRRKPRSVAKPINPITKMPAKTRSVRNVCCASRTM